MADFLDHLITRTLGRGAAIQPRPPALFESPHAPEEWTPEEPVTPAPPRAGQPAADSPPQLLSPQPLSPPLPAPMPTVASPRSALPATAPPVIASPVAALPVTALPAGGVPAAELPAPVPTAIARSARPSATPPAEPSVGANVPLASVAALPAAGGSTAEPAGPPPRLLEPSREADPPATRRSRRAPAPLPHALAELSGTRITSSANGSGTRTGGMAPVGPGEWAWPPAPGSSLSQGTDSAGERVRVVGQPTAAPAIQVTIGRVEVRASAAAPPERASARQPTVMSLDEYLKRAR